MSGESSEKEDAQTDRPETSENRSRAPVTERPKSYIVGIGASAGGLESLERFFRAMPLDTAMSFVVLQHLSPDFKSMMDELLARRTKIPISQATDGITLEADHIYLIPPRKEVIVSGDTLLLNDQDPNQLHSLPIDHFLRSLAQEVQDRAIAVILSGTGSDGSRGIRDIHAAGGLVVAESEETAKFDGMPRSAIETGIVDLVLEPENIPAALTQYTQGTLTSGNSAADDAAGGGEKSVTTVFRLLNEAYGIDFKHYKPATVARRIQRRLSMNQSMTIEDYAEFIKNDANELNSLYKDLLIGVTHFFRDADAFKKLERDIVPDLLMSANPNSEVRVWVAGCATGEEAYSLAILFHEHLERLKKPLNIKIFATDVHQSSLITASAGVYSEEALKDVTPGRLSRYFKKQSDGYHVAQELRQMIVFAPHNVLKDAPFTKIDLITCRNLLIYFQSLAQKKCLSLFHFALKARGTLFLGPSESPGDLADEFETIDEHCKLYRKRRDVRLPADMRVPLAATSGARPTRQVRMQLSSPERPDSMLLSMYDRLLDRFMPPSFLIDDQRRLLHTFSGGERFLTFRSGRPSLSLLDAIDPSLKAALTGALQRAASKQTAVRFESVPVRTGEGERHFTFTVEPIHDPHTSVMNMLVSIEELDVADTSEHDEPDDPSVLDAAEASRDRIATLETELTYTKENLQAAIEELETSNEELQATNEELVASNEELQSTNEELHSVNEELYTVNSEYQKKIAELTQLTDDMNNLLESTEVGTIFLDRDLCIRKFTPQIGKAFQLMPQDIGRPIGAFSPNIERETLVGDVRKVLETEQRIEREVQDRAGNWYYLRILPYRTRQNIEGVLLTLIDISQLKSTRAKLQRLSAIVESSDDAIIAKDFDGTILNWNAGAEKLFGYSEQEVAGQHISLILADGQVDDASQISDQLRRGEDVPTIETTRKRKDGRVLDVSLKFSPVRDARGEVVGISAICRDVSDRKLAEREIRESVERRDQFLAMLSHELRNPLSAIINANSVLSRDQSCEDELDEAKRVIGRQSQQMARLLDDLLDVSRITRGRIDLRKHVIDLTSTVDDAVQTVRKQIESRNLDFRVEIADSPLYVDGDPSRLQQIQVNLLTNAVKYTPPGESIRLRIGREENDAVIRLRDTGEGIPEDSLEKIFDLFVQSDTTIAHSDGGIGIGLTLVRSIVEMHGGTIRAHSDGSGQGSEFVVRLPLVPAPDPAAQPTEDEPPAKPRPDRVLIVEDNTDSRKMLDLLLQLSGFQVTTASDGLEAVERFQKEPPDVALVDIGLPGIDGYEVARRVREMCISHSIYLIALTGYGQQSDREKALAAGFDEHLVKPLQHQELVRVLSHRAAHAPGSDGQADVD